MLKALFYEVGLSFWPWCQEPCYLNPLTLTCLGHEMAASCLTFLLCGNVTVSSYSFMVIADKKPQP